MEMKAEGAVIPPVPIIRRRTAPERSRLGILATRDRSWPLCEMCGHTVVGSHTQRLCPHCGSMAGSSRTFE